MKLKTTLTDLYDFGSKRITQVLIENSAGGGNDKVMEEFLTPWECRYRAGSTETQRLEKSLL